MEITKKMVNLFRGVCAEYGNKEAIRRMKNILHINTEIEDANLMFLNNFIAILDPNMLTIVFEDDYYYTKRDYPTYSTYTYYDQQGLEFRRATAYKTKNGILVLDRMDTEQVLNTRIIKTTEDDIDFVNGYYEKEMMSIPNLPVEEVSSYLEYANDDEEESRVIKVANNMYYYNRYSKADDNKFLEASACIDTPKAWINGRTRTYKDLLYYSERAPYPNIFIRGNVTDEHKNTTYYYDLSIYKLRKEGIIEVQVELINQLDGSLQKKRHLLVNATKGPISKRDILGLINFFTQLNYPFTEPVVEELSRINDKLSIHHQEKLRDLDAIDLEILMNPEYGELAFHIYENLDKIDAFIEEKIHRDLSEEHKKTLG